MSTAAEGTWTKKADMPTARLGLSTNVVNGKIYAIGGGYSIDGPHSRIVQEYDPVTDTWARKGDMPTGRLGHAASVVNGKIYVIGGDVHKEVSGREVEEYDPATDTWTTKADMPTRRTFLASCAVDGKIYVIGGITAPEMRTPSGVEVYDPATDTWTTKADMPTPRSMAAASVLGGKIYLIGGVIGDVGGGGMSITEEYDPVTDTWMQKADMSIGRKALSASAAAGKIHATGGGTGYGDPFSVLEEYDPATDTWTRKADMPMPRYFHSTSAVDGKIYLFGGTVNYPPTAATPRVQEYDPSPFVADLNADEIVNFKDFSMLAKYWYQDQSPLVNYRLSYRDFAVLADYWLTEILPVSLIARWKLDEAEGFIAHDSAGDHDGTLHGAPIWQPAGGIINGALELDGIGDYVSTPFVVGAVDAPFSAFAWIKGGAPGQVILSQRGAPGVAWLATDPSDGSLVTDYPGLLRRSLASQMVVTDGQWHRVGLVWNPPDRMLYIDDVEVASDKHPLLGGSDAGFYIGAGSNLDPGTFWSGLLDDVRIYNRAIVP
jgi:N-acetylneuraminic acid mutarotase